MPSKSPPISVFLQLKNDAPSGAAPEKILVYRGKHYEVIDKSAKSKKDKGVSALFQLYHLRKHIRTTKSVEEQQGLLAVAKQIQVKKRSWFIRIFSAIQNLFCGYGLKTSYGIYKNIEEIGKKLSLSADLPKPENSQGGIDQPKIDKENKAPKDKPSSAADKKPQTTTPAPAKNDTQAEPTLVKENTAPSANSQPAVPTETKATSQAEPAPQTTTPAPAKNDTQAEPTLVKENTAPSANSQPAVPTETKTTSQAEPAPQTATPAPAKNGTQAEPTLVTENTAPSANSQPAVPTETKATSQAEPAPQTTTPATSKNDTQAEPTLVKENTAPSANSQPAVPTETKTTSQAEPAPQTAIPAPSKNDTQQAEPTLVKENTAPSANSQPAVPPGKTRAPKQVPTSKAPLSQKKTSAYSEAASQSEPAPEKKEANQPANSQTVAQAEAKPVSGQASTLVQNTNPEEGANKETAIPRPPFRNQIPTTPPPVPPLPNAASLSHIRPSQEGSSAKTIQFPEMNIIPAPVSIKTVTVPSKKSVPKLSSDLTGHEKMARQLESQKLQKKFSATLQKRDEKEFEALIKDHSIDHLGFHDAFRFEKDDLSLKTICFVFEKLQKNNLLKKFLKSLIYLSPSMITFCNATKGALSLEQDKQAFYMRRILTLYAKKNDFNEIYLKPFETHKLRKRFFKTYILACLEFKVEERRIQYLGYLESKPEIVLEALKNKNFRKALAESTADSTRKEKLVEWLKEKFSENNQIQKEIKNLS